MARPQKDGLDYFPFDVDFMKDKNTPHCALSLHPAPWPSWCCLPIFTARGYYMNWEEDTCFDLSETLQYEPELAAKIVMRAFWLRFFNVDLFQDKAVLAAIPAALTWKLIRIANNAPSIPNLVWLNYRRSTQPPKPKRKGRKRAASDEAERLPEAVTSGRNAPKGNKRKPNKGENSTKSKWIKQTTEERHSRWKSPRWHNSRGLPAPTKRCRQQGEPAVVSNGLSSRFPLILFFSRLASLIGRVFGSL